MKITNVRDFRNKASAYLKADEPVLVTRHGKIAGIFLPLDNADHLPLDIRKELLIRLGNYIKNDLENKNISEEEILDDFQTHRKNCR